MWDSASALAGASFSPEERQVTQLHRSPNKGPEEASDFTALYPQLQEQTNNSIIFTHTALRSWEKSKYREPERMREALETLAYAATKWCECRANIGTRLTQWLAEDWQLNHSAIDKGLEKKHLHKFTFEGRTYFRKNHIKLDDHVPPSGVGRIYFALDTDNLRWIVDHVGLKLYGL
ncbi:MAG: hypothetical protein ABIS86_06810 [Streptosporangiaceae bacterium]